MGDDTDRDNLISFAKAKERVDAGGPFTTKPHSFKLGECTHRHGFDVDAQEHEVTCKSCSEVIDPFKAIEIVAYSWDWAGSRHLHKRLKDENKRLSDDVEKLKALRGKLRGEASIPHKVARKALNSLSDNFKRRSAAATGRGDKAGADAYEKASYDVRSVAGHLVGAALQDEESADD